MAKRLLWIFICSLSSSLLAQNLSLLSTLEAGIIESSGLVNLNGTLVTHNDSGGENALYEIDSSTGDIVRSVYISNAVNRDWEDICIDNDFIYIADFGNNNGNRTNLAVYKINILDYLNTPNDTVLADTINFSYQDQVDFTSVNNNTNFDSEAIISYDSLLYIFSKNWIDSKCNVYSLSKSPGTYSIAKVDSFDSDGLITGACYNSASNTILLTGYGPPIPFVIRMVNISTMPFSSNYRIHNFVQVPNGTSVQIEAVCPLDEDQYYISSEQSVLGSAMLSTLDVNELLPIRNIELSQRKLFPNPSTDLVHIELNANEYLRIYKLEGSMVFESFISPFSCEGISKGVYHLVVYSKDDLPIARSKFVVR